MLLGVVGSLVQARYVAPEEMGVFRTFGIVAGYLTFLHLGVFDGLQREVPIQLGRGDRVRAERAASASLTWILFASAVSAALFVGLALQAAWNSEWMQFWGWLAFTPAVVGTMYGGYLGTTFRTSQQFRSLSRSSVISAGAGTLVLPLLPVMGYYGACLRTSVSSLANLLSLHQWRPMKVRPVLDWRAFREVVRIGLPLSGIGYVGTALWISVEGTLVLKWYGLEALGLYSMAVFLRGFIVQLAQNVNQVIGVKIYEQYGRTGRIDHCLALSLKPAAIATLASLPLVATGWALVPGGLLLVAPKYEDAALMAQLMLLMLPLTFLRLPATILWATGRTTYCFIPIAAGFLVFVAGAELLWLNNSGAVGVVIASLVGLAVTIAGSGLLVWQLIREERSVDQRLNSST